MSVNQAELKNRLNEQQMLLNSYIREFNSNGSVDGFINAQLGRKIVVTYPTSSTEQYSFQQGSTVLIVLLVTYTDATKANLSSVERTT